MTDRVRDTASRRTLTLVVSAAPVFGNAIAEGLQRAAIKTDFSGLGEETYDNEPWSANPPALERFLDAFAPLESVVFLSGDVHYAFSSATDYVGGDGRQARFVQLTSSAVKNWSPYTSVLATADNVAGTGATTKQTLIDFVKSLPDQLDVVVVRCRGAETRAVERPGAPGGERAAGCSRRGNRRPTPPAAGCWARSTSSARAPCSTTRAARGTTR